MAIQHTHSSLQGLASCPGQHLTQLFPKTTALVRSAASAPCGLAMGPAGQNRAGDISCFLLSDFCLLGWLRKPKPQAFLLTTMSISSPLQGI